MYREIKPRIVGKQFKLPLDEASLNHLYNDEYVDIIDEKVFQDRAGDIVIFVKYERYEDPDNEETNNEEDPLVDLSFSENEEETISTQQNNSREDDLNTNDLEDLEGADELYD